MGVKCFFLGIVYINPPWFGYVNMMGVLCTVTAFLIFPFTIVLNRNLYGAKSWMAFIYCVIVIIMLYWPVFSFLLPFFCFLWLLAETILFECSRRSRIYYFVLGKTSLGNLLSFFLEIIEGYKRELAIGCLLVTPPFLSDICKLWWESMCKLIKMYKAEELYAGQVFYLFNYVCVELIKSLFTSVYRRVRDNLLSSYKVELPFLFNFILKLSCLIS